MRSQTLDDPSSSPEHCERRLEVLRPFINEGSVGAELGVFKGSFIDFLLTQRPAKLFAVDPWYRDRPDWPWANGDTSTLNAFLRILNDFSPEINQGIVVPIVEFSQTYLKTVEDNYFDWVYIDTTHSYQQTWVELELCVQKVKPGGFITGDDYFKNPSHRHHGVYKAVQEFLAAKKVEMVLEGNHNQFVVAPVKS